MLIVITHLNLIVTVCLFVICLVTYPNFLKNYFSIKTLLKTNMSKLIRLYFNFKTKMFVLLKVYAI